MPRLAKRHWRSTFPAPCRLGTGVFRRSRTEQTWQNSFVSSGGFNSFAPADPGLLPRMSPAEDHVKRIATDTNLGVWARQRTDAELSFRLGDGQSLCSPRIESHHLPLWVTAALFHLYSRGRSAPAGEAVYLHVDRGNRQFILRGTETIIF